MQTNLLGLVAEDTVVADSNAWGTGVFIWDYQNANSAYLLTAKHVLNSRHKLQIFVSDSGSFTPLYKSPIPLLTDSGVPRYLTYISASGESPDIALLPVPNAGGLIQRFTFKMLVRSCLAFTNEVKLASPLLALGFADPQKFPFIKKGDPLVVSGIVSQIIGPWILIDKRLHEGMSGGIVLVQPHNVVGLHRYLVGGIVAAEYKFDSSFSLITKLDYIDSILIQNTGVAWGYNSGNEQ
ncbi:MAG: trypsin-like peptidase domain-containing protein [bacterium]